MAERYDVRAKPGWGQTPSSRPDPASTPQSDFAKSYLFRPQFLHLKGVGLDPFALAALVNVTDIQWSPHDVFA